MGRLCRLIIVLLLLLASAAAPRTAVAAVASGGQGYTVNDDCVRRSVPNVASR